MLLRLLLILTLALGSSCASSEKPASSRVRPDDTSAIALMRSGLRAYRHGGGGAALQAWTRGSSTGARQRALPLISRFTDETADYGRFIGERIIAVDRVSPQTIVVYFQLRHEDGYGWGRLVFGCPTGKWETHQVVLGVEAEKIIPGKHRRLLEDDPNPNRPHRI